MNYKMLRPWEFRTYNKSYMSQIWIRYRLNDRVRNTPGIAQVRFVIRRGSWDIASAHLSGPGLGQTYYMTAQEAMRDCDTVLERVGYRLLTIEQVTRLQAML